MPVQNHIHTARHLTRIRRDMRQIKTQMLSLQCKRKRPRHLPIAIAPHHKQRHAELLKFHQPAWLADIPQMPNLVSRPQRKPLRQPQRKPIMSVRKNRNAHEDRKPKIYTCGAI